MLTVLAESIREQQSNTVSYRSEDTLNKFPTLKSKLVRLRQLRHKDMQTMARLVTEQVVRYLVHVPYPYEIEDARRFINKSRRNFQLKKEQTFAIEFVGNLVGVISLQKIDRVNKNAQISYWIRTSYWNLGIATESINLLIHYAFCVLRLHKVYANVLNSNRAS